VSGQADPEQAQRSVHEGLAGFLDEGEIAISWLLVIDVAGQDGKRYLAHRAGGGIDGQEQPTIWGAAGMLTCALDEARGQMSDATEPPEGDE
jgi:hypothetical protein